MSCPGICEKYRAYRTGLTSGFTHGNKRCRRCDIFIKFDGMFCPCCFYKLQTKSRKKPTKNGVKAQALINLETLIQYTIVMKLSEKESRVFLKTRGHEISKIKYYEIKQKLREKREKRAHDIASFELLDQHMERIDNLITVEHEQWRCYNTEKDKDKRSIILERIANMQSDISAAYDATRKIMEKQAELKKLIEPIIETKIS